MKQEAIGKIESDARERIEAAMPAVELLVCEGLGHERLRMVIDSPDGVDLELCESVTALFPDLLEEYSLEVSSPGPERPLRTAEHFASRVGERVRIQTDEPMGGSRNFVGELLSAGKESCLLATEQGDEIEIDFGSIARANLAPSTEQGSAGSDKTEMTESEVNA